MRFKTFFSLSVAVVMGLAPIFSTQALAQISNPLDRPQSGVIAATTAPVNINYLPENGQMIGRIADVGDPIFLNDEVATGPNDKLQVLLSDQTVFSIGPNSVLVFDEFIYDPGSSDGGSLVASVKRGSFKFISGKIAKQGPEAMKLKLPNASASIRGTSVAGRVGDDGEADLLLLSGAIEVASAALADPVALLTPGWGTSIDAAGSVAPPVQFPPELVEELVSAVEFVAPQIAAAIEAQQDGDGTGTTTGSGLTPETVETIEDVVTLVAENVAVGEDGNINVSNLANYLRSSGLAGIIGLSEEDLADAPAGLNIEAELLSYLIAGGQPLWLTVQNDGGGAYSLVNPPTSGDQLQLYNQRYADLVSSSYQGSIRFQKSGLALEAGSQAFSVPSNYNYGNNLDVTVDGNDAFATFSSNIQSSGTVDYNVLLNYETTQVTGTFALNNLVVNGQSYSDVNKNINLANLSSYTETSGIELFPTDTLGSGANQVNLDFRGDFGSISDGNNVLDGLIGSFGTEINHTTLVEFAEISADPSAARDYTTEYGALVSFDNNWTLSNGTQFQQGGVTWDLRQPIGVSMDGTVSTQSVSQLTAAGYTLDNSGDTTFYRHPSDDSLSIEMRNVAVIPTAMVEQYEIGTPE